MSVPWRCLVGSTRRVGWVERSETHAFGLTRWVSQVLNPSYRLLHNASPARHIQASPRFRAVGGEQVAGPPDRPDHGWPRRIGLDLLADASDAYIDGAVEGLTVARLGEVKEPLAREHALGVLGECLEQRKFGACERVLVAALVAQHARIDVQPLGAEPDRRPRGGRGRRRGRSSTAAQHYPDARQELAQLARL